MSSPHEKLPPLETAAADLSHALASDHLLKGVFGEHIGHSGYGFSQYMRLTEQENDGPFTRYEGLQTAFAERGPTDEERAALEIPLGQELWLAYRRTVDIPSGDVIDEKDRIDKTRLGYCWENEDGSWSTDVRNLCDPQEFGALVAERNARFHLIQTVRGLGLSAVFDYMRTIPETSTTVKSRKGEQHTASFDADYIRYLVGEHRSMISCPVPLPLSRVITILLRDESAN